MRAESIEDSTTNLIERLASESKPVKRLWHPGKRMLLWSIFSFCLSIAFICLSGDFRAGYLEDLFSNSRFFLEITFGVLSAVVAAWYGFQMAVPGRDWSNLDRFLSIFPFLIFTALTLYGIINPTFKPSWVGWRFGCEREILFFGAVPMVIFFLMVKKAAPIENLWAGFLLSIASMAPLATLMHVACMYDPGHQLGFHIGPIIIASLVGVKLAGRFLKV